MHHEKRNSKGAQFVWQNVAKKQKTVPDKLEIISQLQKQEIFSKKTV